MAHMDGSGSGPGFGRGFGRVWTASTVSAFGDGVTQLAGGLLAASLTRNPMEVSGLMIAQQLPMMAFALPSGVMVDRMDHRRLMAAVCLVRAAALALLGVAIAAGHPTLPMLYVVFFVIGCAGLLFENASVALLPSIVDVCQLERANGRLQATNVLSQQLAAKPLGGLLFALGAWVPFAVDPAALLMVATLVTALPVTLRPGSGPVPSLRAAIGDGIRWLARHRLLRTMSVTVGLSNLGLGAMFSILVLVARERLGVGPVGYGILWTAVAVGGIIGGLSANRIVAVLGAGSTLRIGLIIEMFVHLGFALTRSAVTGGLLLALLGLHLVVFSTIGASLRQALVPAELLGRVHSAYRLVTNAGMLLGSVLGGVLGRYLGLAAPFWFGLACVATLIVFAWSTLSNDTVDAARRR